MQAERYALFFSPAFDTSVTVSVTCHAREAQTSGVAAKAAKCAKPPQASAEKWAGSSAKAPSTPCLFFCRNLKGFRVSRSNTAQTSGHLRPSKKFVYTLGSGPDEEGGTGATYPQTPNGLTPRRRDSSHHGPGPSPGPWHRGITAVCWSRPEADWSRPEAEGCGTARH